MSDSLGTHTSVMTKETLTLAFRNHRHHTHVQRATQATLYIQIINRQALFLLLIFEL